MGQQGIVHVHVDVQKWIVIFMVLCSKIYGTNRVGILYKSHYLNEMPPYMGTGDMVGTVTYQKTSYTPIAFEVLRLAPQILLAHLH